MGVLLFNKDKQQETRKHPQIILGTLHKSIDCSFSGIAYKNLIIFKQMRLYFHINHLWVISMSERQTCVTVTSRQQENPILVKDAKCSLDIIQ